MKHFIFFLAPFFLLQSCGSTDPGKKQEAVGSDIKTETALISEITCPQCGFKKTETMPTDFCQIKYTCTHCQAELFPKEEDCCVFCSYGSHQCPSKQ